MKVVVPREMLEPLSSGDKKEVLKLFKENEEESKKYIRGEVPLDECNRRMKSRHKKVEDIVNKPQYLRPRKRRGG